MRSSRSVHHLIADEIFHSSEQSERFSVILFLYSLGICRLSSSGLDPGLFVKEAVFVMPPFVTKMSCSFDMAYAV